ncbi:MAG TPA: hypothetical protein VGL64_06550 [Amycolatopsis sp.]
MKTRSLRTRRTLTFAATAAVIGLASAACQAGAQPAASAPADPSQTVPTIPAPTANSVAPVVSSGSSPATASKPTAPGPRAKATPTELKFPNTTVDVVFTGYDTKNKLVEFQKVVQDPASPAAHLVPDPSDPAVHELPMASEATVKSIDPNGFPFETCPPVSCTADNIMESVIGHYNGAFYAHIHVNAADRIDSVAQSAY